MVFVLVLGGIWVGKVWLDMDVSVVVLLVGGGFDYWVIV